MVGFLTFSGGSKGNIGKKRVKRLEILFQLFWKSYNLFTVKKNSLSGHSYWLTFRMETRTFFSLKESVNKMGAESRLFCLVLMLGQSLYLSKPNIVPKDRNVRQIDQLFKCSNAQMLEHLKKVNVRKKGEESFTLSITRNRKNLVTWRIVFLRHAPLITGWFGHKTFRRSILRLPNVLCTFSQLPVSRRNLSKDMSDILETAGHKSSIEKIFQKISLSLQENICDGVSF